MKKRMFSVFICMALCLSLLPTTVLAGDTVSFIEYSWNKDTSTLTSATKSVSDYTTITNSTTNWNNTATGWYVAQGDVTIGSETVPQSVTVNGDVRLILADGCTLTVNGGIQVAENNSLTIYGQSGGTGKLTVTYRIPIEGGYDYTHEYDAAIGGNGQEVKDDSTGGIGAPGGTVTIHGGTVTAQGDLGAGIGGGSGNTAGAGGTVTITGGTVTAQGDLGAGIGGGNGDTAGDGGTVTITGGTVTATGDGGGGAGIGGGSGTKGLGRAGTFSTSANGNAVIFASSATGSNHIQATESPSTPWQGVIFQGNEGKVYGTNVTPTKDFTIPSGKTLAIEDGKTLTIPEGVTLTVENGGTLSGSINGKQPPQITISPADVSVTAGSPATFTVAASAGEDDTLSYQWQKKTTDSGSEWEDISSATSDTYHIDNTATGMSGNQYRCVVTGAASRVSVISAAATLTVTAKPTYTITVSQTAGGTVNADKTTAAEGETVTLTATPDSGYHFDGWNVASNNVTIQNNQFTMPAGNVEIQAIFALNSSGSSDPTYSVTLPGEVEGGTVTANKRYAEKGETFRFTVTPDEGWELDTLTVTDRSGKKLEVTHKGGGVYAFQMPAGQVEIEISFREVKPEPLPFTDVREDTWYSEAVRYVYEHGLMAGTGAATFGPDVTTSRSMIATILWRIAGSPVVNYAMNFSDVPQGQWYSEAVRWAASEGVVSGYGDGSFGTNDPITREQFALMLWRLAQNQGYDVSVGENTNILSYTDVSEASEYAVPALQWAVGAGIISGTGDGSTLSPQGQATRAQAAVMLMRFCEKYVTW